MILTKRKALTDCIRIWEGMRDKRYNALNGKQKVVDDIGLAGKYPFNCPACGLAGQDKNGFPLCKKCILLNLWPYNKELVKDTLSRYRAYCPCEHNPNSPYLPFCEGRGTPADAQRIVDGCKQALRVQPRRRKERANENIRT